MISPPIATKVTPASAFSSGGAKVSISGRFPSIARLNCEFGLLPPVRAVRISATEVMCEVPRSLPGAVSLRVTVDGESMVANSSGLLQPMWSNSTPLPFTMIPDFSISGADVITVKGSYWLIIYGANIPRSPDLQCEALVEIFEECPDSTCASSHVSEASPGKWLNSTSVICPMWLQNNCHKQRSVVPTAGLSAMGKQQYLLHSVTVKAVDSYLNLLKSPTEIQQTLTGWRESAVLSVTPLIASPGGGTEITVTVHNTLLLPQWTDALDNSIRLACLFESLDQKAQVLAIPISSREAVCVTPAWPMSSGPVQVSLIRGLPWNFEVVATTQHPVFSFGPTPSILGLVESLPKGNTAVNISTAGGVTSRLILSTTGLHSGVVSGSTEQTLVCLFSFGGDLASKTRNVTTEAFPISVTKVFCDPPPLPPGQVLVSLALMSHESKTNSVLTNELPFMVSSASPKFREAIPTSIPQSEGEQIHLIGEVIEFSADLTCLFGNVSDEGGENMAAIVPAIYISPTEIVCVAPRFPRAPAILPLRIIGSTLLAPVDAGLISVLPLAPGLSAANQPTSSLKMTYGHAIGGDEVPVNIIWRQENSSNLLSSNEVILQLMITQIVCRFIFEGKSIFVPAMLGDEPYCVTPAFETLVMEGHDDKKLVQVSIALEMSGGKYASISSTSSYLILPTPSVKSVQPSYISNAMGEDIIVRGLGFLNTDSICCLFSRSVGKGEHESDCLLRPSPAIWMSWDVVSCHSPPISYFSEPGSIVKLYVSLNCAHNALLENDGLEISFVPGAEQTTMNVVANATEKAPEAATVSYDAMGALELSLFPPVSPTLGGGTLSVQHWEDVGPIWWDICIYHGSYGGLITVDVPADINGSCAIPEWPYPESVFVELSSSLAMDGTISTHIPHVRLPFDFVQAPLLLTVTPNVLIAQQTQVIRLSALPLFKPLAGLQCVIVFGEGDQMVTRDAFFISEHELSCMSPHLPVGNTTRVYLSLYDQIFSGSVTPLGFGLTVLPQPVAFQAQLIGSEGRVIVIGESLARFASYLSPTCFVGDRTVPSVPLNDSALLCIIGNGEGLYAETETTAMSNIILTNSSSSSLVVPVQLLLGGRNEVVIPAGDVTLLPRPIVLMFTPVEIAEHGGTIVVLTGRHLSGASCRFGDKVVQSFSSNISGGRLEHNLDYIGDASLETISCEAPPFSEAFSFLSRGQTTQSVTLSVSTDGGMGYVSVGMIRYNIGTLTPVIDSIIPSSGHHTGGTQISVRGKGLRNVDTYQCQFVPPSKSEGTVVPGIWVSSSLFQCIVPPLSSGFVSLTSDIDSKSTIVTSVNIMINGKGVSTTNDLHFNYFVTPNPLDVVAAPLTGTTIGGTLVSISGQKLESMKPIERGGASCVFGSVSPSPAVEISPGSVACLSPVGTSGPTTLKLVSFDGLELFQFTYTYIKPSYVTRASPSTVDESRLPDGFTVIGEDFAAGPDLCCHLISLSDHHQQLSIMLDANYLSEDRVWCKIDPNLAIKVGSYDVQVRSHHTQYEIPVHYRPLTLNHCVL